MCLLVYACSGVHVCGLLCLGQKQSDPTSAPQSLDRTDNCAESFSGVFSAVRSEVT